MVRRTGLVEPAVKRTGLAKEEEEAVTYCFFSVFNKHWHVPYVQHPLSWHAKLRVTNARIAAQEFPFPLCVFQDAAQNGS